MTQKAPSEVLSAEYHSLKRRMMLISVALFFLCELGSGALAGFFKEFNNIVVDENLYQFIVFGIFSWLLVDSLLLYLEWNSQGADYLFRTSSDGRRYDELLNFASNDIKSVIGPGSRFWELDIEFQKVVSATQRDGFGVRQPGEWFATTGDIRNITIDVDTSNIERRIDEIFKHDPDREIIKGEFISLVRDSMLPSVKSSAESLASGAAVKYDLNPTIGKIGNLVDQIKDDLIPVSSRVKEIVRGHKLRTSLEQIRVSGFHFVLPMTLAFFAAAHYVGVVLKSMGIKSLDSAPVILDRDPTAFFINGLIVLTLACAASWLLSKGRAAQS